MGDISISHPIPDLDEEGAPVVLPELPTTLVITTAQQMKACADPTRSRILGLIQHQPATATQLALALGVASNKVSYHLRILETAGLVQVVARRLIRGIVAKYYARTARNFIFDAPPEIAGEAGKELLLGFLVDARLELCDVLATSGEQAVLNSGFPHSRLSAEHAQAFAQRLEALLEDFMNRPPDPNGQVYALSFAYFRAPPSLQVTLESPEVREASGAVESAVDRRENA